MKSEDTEKLNYIAKVTHILFDSVSILKDLSSVASALEAEAPTYTSDLGTLCNLAVSREKYTLSGPNSSHCKVKPKGVQVNHIVEEPI